MAARMTSLTGNVKSNHWSRGFTLIELIVVLGIIGLVVVMSLPAFTGYVQQVRLKTATRETVKILRLARQLAIGSRQPRTVTIDPADRALVIEETRQEDEPRAVRLPPSVQIAVDVPGQADPPWRLVFQPSGALAGRSAAVNLSSQTRTQTITVTAPTGSVMVQ